MNGRLGLVLLGTTTAIATAVLAAGSVSAYPIDAEGSRLVTAATSTSTTTAAKAAKKTTTRRTVRPKPTLMP